MRRFPYIDMRSQRFIPSEPTADTWTLSHSTPSNNQCKISTGTITMAGQNITVPETTVDLTGATEFVFVQVERSTKTATVGHSSVRPTPNSTYFYLVLVSFTATSGTYDTGTVHHKGDYTAEATI